MLSGVGWGIAPGWEEVTNIMSVHVGSFIYDGCVMCLNVIVAVKSPASDVFGWLLHDCVYHCVFNECSQYRVVACFIEYFLYSNE